MTRKAVLAAALTVALAAFGFAPPLVTATEFHSKDVQRGVAAEWNSCGLAAPAPPCPFAEVQAFQTFEQVGDSNGKQDCVDVAQLEGLNPRTGSYSHFIAGSGCDVGVSVNVSGSLARGEVSGALPGRDCQLVIPTEPACVPTTLRLALEWRSIGDVSRSPGVILHHSDFSPDARCLEHFLPYRSTSNATVTGQVDGFSAPLGEPTLAGMGFGEVIEHGTVPVCFD
jgi:hypothetical protein